MQSPHALVLVIAFLALLAPGPGCGSGTPQVVVTPMTADDEIAFENGLDFIDDPTLLEGSWLDSWQQDIERRVQLADAIVLLRVQTVRTDTDLEHQDTYRLLATVEQVRLGENVPDEVTLIAREGEPGFGTIQENDDRVLDQRFIAYLRWTRSESGTLGTRWHLSPAGERVIARVNTLVELRRTAPDERRRVIVRQSHE
jgi:hypothetical protein